MAIEWVKTSGREIALPTLLELYKIYQDRQKADLDLHLRFANWYSATLAAIESAFVLGFVRFFDNEWAGLLAILPLVGVLLVHQGRLATYRFYPRYTEGRVRLTKIEYILGLDGPINPVGFTVPMQFQQELWPQDMGLLPARYFLQSYGTGHSGTFIRGRSRGYGIQLITKRTMGIFFVLLCATLFLFLVAHSCSCNTKTCIAVGVVVGVASLVTILLSQHWYDRTLEQFEAETPEYPAPSASNA